MKNMTHFCLGTGAIACNGCPQESNWQTLNQMPDVLRKSMQLRMQRIDDTACILSGRPWYPKHITEYWCPACGRALPVDSSGMVVHDAVPHPPNMVFDGKERPQ